MTMFENVNRRSRREQYELRQALINTVAPPEPKKKSNPKTRPKSPEISRVAEGGIK